MESEPPEELTADLSRGRLFLRFLRYGLLAWGGPIAQIGLMHRELVERDRWVPPERFRKVLALYQALPGPEANELAVYFGMLKGGRVGGLLAGLGFMVPGVVFVTLLAAIYLELGTQPVVVDVLLYGVKPAVLALVAAAAVRLGRQSLSTPLQAGIAGGTLVAMLLLSQVHFLFLLLAGGLIGYIAARKNATSAALVGFPFAFVVGGPAVTLPVLAGLGLLALQMGLLTFGGAYTALPILHQGAVVDNGWITEQQFLDGLGLAALVPGPLIAIGTFVGYVAGGLPGALIMTVLVFGPAFAFTLVGHRFFERLVDEPRVHGVLLGVMAAAIGLIAALSVSIAGTAVTDLPTAIIALLAFFVILRRPYVAPVVLGGAIVGVLVQYVQLAFAS